jgi:hypothetical protein
MSELMYVKHDDEYVTFIHSVLEFTLSSRPTIPISIFLTPSVLRHLPHDPTHSLSLPSDIHIAFNHVPSVGAENFIVHLLASQNDSRQSRLDSQTSDVRCHFAVVRADGCDFQRDPLLYVSKLVLRWSMVHLNMPRDL